MRKGSVQKTRDLTSAASELVTASESSMGSSGGTTDVMIMMQWRSSLKRLRSSSCSGIQKHTKSEYMLTTRYNTHS